MRKVVFDIETKNIFQDVGKNDPSLLDISLVGVYDSGTDTYATFLQEEFSNLWPIIEKADMLIGYNSDHFDIPLLNKYYHGDLSKIKSLDLLAEIKNSFGRRIGLDLVAQGTLGKKKGGHGLDAVTWWKKGEIDKIRKYCIEDVKLTKEIYDYAIANQKIKIKDGPKIIEVPLNTSDWEKKKSTSMTFSLPF